MFKFKNRYCKVNADDVQRILGSQAEANKPLSQQETQESQSQTKIDFTGRPRWLVTVLDPKNTSRKRQRMESGRYMLFRVKLREHALLVPISLLPLTRGRHKCRQTPRPQPWVRRQLFNPSRRPLLLSNRSLHLWSRNSHLPELVVASAYVGPAATIVEAAATTAEKTLPPNPKVTLAVVLEEVVW